MIHFLIDRSGVDTPLINPIHTVWWGWLKRSREVRDTSVKPLASGKIIFICQAGRCDLEACYIRSRVSWPLIRCDKWKNTGVIQSSNHSVWISRHTLWNYSCISWGTCKICVAINEKMSIFKMYLYFLKSRQSVQTINNSFVFVVFYSILFSLWMNNISNEMCQEDKILLYTLIHSTVNILYTVIVTVTSIQY